MLATPARDLLFVASEVGNLAIQTTRATEEIAAQIADIHSATNISVQAIEGITSTIGEINVIVTGISAAVEEQRAATQEIARNVEQAAAGTQEVTSSITKVSSAAGETGQAAGQIDLVITKLGGETKTMRRYVEEFLDEIQAV